MVLPALVANETEVSITLPEIARVSKLHTGVVLAAFVSLVALTTRGLVVGVAHK